MFKTAAAAAALCTLLSGSAFAQSLLAGQYIGVTQYTGIIDPAQICASLGLAAGQVSTSVATVTGLSASFTSVIASAGTGTQSNPYGVAPITCAFGTLPAPGDFTKNSDGSYTAKPSTPSVTTCTSAKGTFTLTSENGTWSGNIPAVYAVGILAVPTGNQSSAFSTNSTNTQLAVGGTTLCYLSTSAQYGHSK